MKVSNLSIKECNLEVKRALEMPSPDHYVPQDRLIRTTRFETAKFSSMSRVQMSKASDATPGPGAYQNTYGQRSTS